MEICYFRQENEIMAFNRAQYTSDPYRFLFDYMLTGADKRFLEEGCHIKL